MNGIVKDVTIADLPFLNDEIHKFINKHVYKDELELDLKHIKAYTDEEGKESYSIPIKTKFADDSEDYFFENLNYVKLNEQFISFITKYNASDDSKAFDFKNFTGKLEIFDDSKVYLGVLTFENGILKHLDPAPPGPEETTGGAGGADPTDPDCPCNSSGNSFLYDLFHSVYDFIAGITITPGSGNTGTNYGAGYITVMGTSNNPGGTGNSNGTGTGVIVPNYQWPALTSFGGNARMIGKIIIQRLTGLNEVSKNWLRNTATLDQNRSIYIFLSDYDYPETEGDRFATEMIDRMSANPTVFTSIAPFLIERNIDDSNLDPCSKNVLRKLKNATQADITFIIQKFDNLSGQYNVKYNSQIPLINSSNDAETDYQRDSAGNPLNFNYLVNLHPGYTSTATKIAIARTILHELLHAHLLSIVDNLSISTVVNPADYPAIYNAVQNNTYGNIDLEALHHYQISRKYIEPIRDALQQFDNSSMPLQYYEDLAWGALFNTITFNKVYPIGNPNRDRIKAVNLAEDTNTNVNSGSQIIIPHSTPCP